MTSDYRSELTYELRQRGLPESTVRDIVSELPPDTDSALEREFGTARDYAGSFPNGKRRTTGWFIISGAAAVGALVILWRVVATATGLVERNVGMSVTILVGAVVLVALASVAAAAVDRRRSGTSE